MKCTGTYRHFTENHHAPHRHAATTIDPPFIALRRRYRNHQPWVILGNRVVVTATLASQLCDLLHILQW